MRLRRPLGAMLVGPLLVACSGGGLVLELDTTSVPADGVSVVELTANVTFRGASVVDGRTVSFSAAAPVLFESLEDTMPEVEGGRPLGATEVEVETRGGMARAYLVAPLATGPLDVAASYTASGEVLTDASVLMVSAAPPVAAGSGACGALGSLISHLDLRCERDNVGAFVTGRPEIRVPCHLTARDAAGHELPHTVVELYAEAGNLVDEPATADTPRTITYVVPAVPSVLPRDTAPMPGESGLGLSLAGAQLLPGANEQNPRDGLVTLLVVARGHEAYLDDDGNGRWDDGECYQEEGEPFLDVDDDGVYDPGSDGTFIDVDGNGHWDGPNGRFDADRPIGRLSHILWSGPLFADAYRAGIRSSDGAYSLPALGQKTLTLRAVDANFNPIAALDDDDHIDFSLDGEPARKVQFVDPPDPDVGLAATAGLHLLAGYPQVIFDGAHVIFDRIADECAAGYCGRDWRFFIGDSRSATDSTLDNCYTWSVEAVVHYTPVDAPGFSRLETPLSATGRLENLADDCP